MHGSLWKSLTNLIHLIYQVKHVSYSDGSYSVPDIQGYFEYIMKNFTIINHSLIGIYVSKIENRVTFRIKKGYYPNFQHLKW